MVSPEEGKGKLGIKSETFEFIPRNESHSPVKSTKFRLSSGAESN